MHYDHVLTALARTPWAIEPGEGQRLAAILSARVRDGRGDPVGIAEAKEIVAARQERKGRSRPKNVALVPVYGVLTQRADVFMEASGLMSADQIGQVVDAAAADPGVDAIVLDIDSPGGSVFGISELGAKIAAAGRQKKVVAVANSTAASGAYWVASQASELVVTPGGMVGSIGVYLMHVDRSEEMKAKGQAVSFVATSEKKVAGNEFGPLGDAGAAEFKQIVDGYYSQFVKAVAGGRGVAQSKVKEDFGGGGMLLAADAVKVGMADKVATLDEVLAKYGISMTDMAQAQADLDPRLEIRRRAMALDTGLDPLAFTHNSKLAESEPDWGEVDKTALPRLAFADRGDAADKSSWRFPHHWVKGGTTKDSSGVWADGTLYLHKGGLEAAWAAAHGARSGRQASSAVIAHLERHRKAIGLD